MKDLDTPHPKRKRSKTWVQNDQHHTKFIKAQSIQKFNYASHGIFGASYVLRKDCFNRVFAKYVGIRNRNIYVQKSIWVPRVLVTDMKEPNQMWVPKNRA